MLINFKQNKPILFSKKKKKKKKRRSTNKLKTQQKDNMKQNKNNRLESEIVKEPILSENRDFDLRNPKL